MAIDSPDEALLKRFLVGDVSLEERTQIEDSFMGDDNLYDALAGLEQEMILDHLRGELPPALAVPFATLVASSPEWKRRVAEVQGLMSALAAPAAPARVLTFRRRFLRGVLVPLTAAALLMLVVGINVFRNSARPPRPQTQAPGPVERVPVDVVFDLRPVVRGPNDGTNIFTVPPGTDTVTLTFPLTLEPQERPTVSLRPADAPPLAPPTRPVIEPTADGRTAVRWTIPATFLPAGDYIVTVTTDAGSGPRIRLTRSFTIMM